MNINEFWLKINWRLLLKGPFNNIPTLLQIMACHWEGDKLLSEPTTVSLLTPICVAWPHWVENKLILFKLVSWRRTDDNPISQPMMTKHYDDVIMSTIASQITSLTIVYSTVHWGADQSKHQSPASLAFVWGIHRGPVNSPHKWPVTRKMFPFDDVIMIYWKIYEQYMRHSASMT